MFIFIFATLLLGALVGSAVARLKMYRHFAYHGGPPPGFGPPWHGARFGRPHRFGGCHHHPHHGHDSHHAHGRHGHPLFWETLRDLKGAAQKHRQQARDLAAKLAERFEQDDFDVEQMGEFIEDSRDMAEKVSADALKRLERMHKDLSPRERQAWSDMLRRFS